MYPAEREFISRKKGVLSCVRFFSLGFLATLFLISSPPVKAGVAEECESLKTEGLRVLYALCIAEANAGNENAAEMIRNNQAKWANDEFCPCWTIEDLEQYIACAGLPKVDWEIDTDAQLGADFVKFQNSSVSVSLYAGFASPWEPGGSLGGVIGLENGVPECVLLSSAGNFLIATDVYQDAACRLDVLELIANPPVDCTSP
jgi:hypothetical protein